MSDLNNCEFIGRLAADPVENPIILTEMAKINNPGAHRGSVVQYKTKKAAAEVLGIDKGTLYNRLKYYKERVLLCQE